MLARLRGKPICSECGEPIETLVSAEEIIEYCEFDGENYEFLNSEPLAGGQNRISMSSLWRNSRLQ